MNALSFHNIFLLDYRNKMASTFSSTVLKYHLLYKEALSVIIILLKKE